MIVCNLGTGCDVRHSVAWCPLIAAGPLSNRYVLTPLPRDSNTSIAERERSLRDQVQFLSLSPLAERGMEPNAAFGNREISKRMNLKSPGDVATIRRNIGTKMKRIPICADKTSDRIISGRPFQVRHGPSMKPAVRHPMLLSFALALLAGCGGTSIPVLTAFKGNGRLATNRRRNSNATTISPYIS